MSEREHRIDVCPECKHRIEDSSKKKLFQCKYCERWFCEKHLEPRVAGIKNLKAKIKEKEWRAIVEKEMEKKDSHPDFAYTEERYDALQKEKQIYRRRFGEFLDKLPPYEEAISKESKRKEELGFVEEESPYESTFTPTKPKRASTVGRAVLVFGIIVLILGVGLMVFPKSSHKEGNFEWGYTDRPVSAFDLGIIPKNVQLSIDYDVEEPFLEALSGRMYVIIINASELLVIDHAWNSRLQPPASFLTFRFDSVDFNYYAYDGPSSKGSLSWTTPYEGHFMVLVWVSEMGGMAGFVYFIRINATWHPYFTYGITLTIVGIVTASVGFTYKRYSSR